MTPMPPATHKEPVSIAIVGHVDHGKSTIIGRFLAEMNALPEGKLAYVREECRRSSKPFEYAFLLDALKDEQSQGITIESARVFFRTRTESYLFIDAPGHREFVRNMITGAARADGAVLVIDAQEGVQENSKRHGFLLSLLGVRQVIVLINKMDLVAYAHQRYRHVRDETTAFLASVGIVPTAAIPVSGREGDGITRHLGHTPWYTGPTLEEALRTVARPVPADCVPFRMPVQDVYKFTNFGDTRRIIAGTISSGTISPGETVVFYPSGKKARVATIETFPPRPVSSAGAGRAAGLTLTDQLYITRGEIAVKENDPPPHVTISLEAGIFWIAPEPLRTGRTYTLKLETARAHCRIERITRVMDTASLATREPDGTIGQYDAAECVLRLDRPLAFDTADQNLASGRFVIVHDTEICGGGTIRSAQTDDLSWMREKTSRRELKWESSRIPREARRQKYRQRPALVILTGKKDSGKKPIAKKLEEMLFVRGQIVYFMGIGNLLYGVDADIEERPANRQELIRRLAEVTHLLLDAGIILIVTAIGLTQRDLEIIQTSIYTDELYTVWVGADPSPDLVTDMVIEAGRGAQPHEAAEQIAAFLKEKEVIEHYA